MQQMFNTPPPLPEELVIDMVEQRVAKDFQVLTPSEVKELSKAVLEWAMVKGTGQEETKFLAVGQLAYSITQRIGASKAGIDAFQVLLVKLQLDTVAMLKEINQLVKEIGEAALMDLSAPTGKPN